MSDRRFGSGSPAWHGEVALAARRPHARSLVTSEWVGDTTPAVRAAIRDVLVACATRELGTPLAAEADVPLVVEAPPRSRP